MDALTVTAASGLRSRMESLSLLANNLANAATNGYKSDRETYGLYHSNSADNPLGSVSTMPTIERQWTDYSQGILQPTGNSFDVALVGPGFLSVNGPSGPLYTRNGAIQVSKSGELLSSDGYPVRGTGGKSIKVAFGHPVDISAEGVVRQDGVQVGKLEIVDFKSKDSLKKMSGTTYQNMDSKNTAVPAIATTVSQGKLEASNVAVPESAMQLVGIMRQFEMLQKAVTIGVEMNAKAITEVARVSS